MKTIWFTLLLVITLIIPIAGATTLGTFKANTCVDLIQICENCTQNNISTIKFPNSTTAISNVIMDRDDTFYNYTFCNTTTMGKYIVNGVGDLDGDKTSWSYDFEITGTGFEFTQSRSTFYVALLGILIFMFILSIIFIPRIPTNDATDDYGMLISVNHLKHLKPLLYVIAWVILLGIMYTSSNIALAYMGAEMFGQLMFVIYKIMFWLTLPMIVIWFIFLIVSIFRDVEIKRLLERGIEIPGGATP